MGSWIAPQSTKISVPIRAGKKLGNIRQHTVKTLLKLIDIHELLSRRDAIVTTEYKFSKAVVAARGYAKATIVELRLVWTIWEA